MRRAMLLLSVGLALVLGGCGSGDDEGGAASATPAASATTGQAGRALDEDALLAVHDELYECLRQADFGVLASYSGGQASVGESAQQPEFDADLAAPKAEAELLDGGKASYVGIRADRRQAGERGTPDWDVLIFPSESDAAAALPALQQEAGTAEQDGLIVRAVKRDGSGAAAEEAETALTGCAEQARPG